MLRMLKSRVEISDEHAMVPMKPTPAGHRPERGFVRADGRQTLKVERLALPRE